MKKYLIPLILVAAAVAAIFLFRKELLPGSRSHVPALVPAETVLFLHLPDLDETRLRWRRTAFYKIRHEPEVEAFVKESVLNVRRKLAEDGNLDRLLRLNPREAFVALTEVNDKVPTFVAGFGFAGNATDVESALAPIKDAMHRTYPAGKSDILKYQTDQIETFTAENLVLATVFKRQWYFISNNLDLLKATIDRCDGRAQGASLGGDADFQLCVSKMPRQYDTLAFAKTRTLIDRISGVFEATGQKASAQQMAELKKIKAVAASTRLEDQKMRDRIFVLQSDVPKAETLAREALAFSSADTILFYSSLLKQRAGMELPDPALDTSGVLRYLQSLSEGLKKEGLSIADFHKAFGPEASVLVDWGAGTPSPAPLLVLDIKEPETAARFVNYLASGRAGGGSWMRQEVGGYPCYTLPASQAVWVAPALVITDKFLICGLDLPAVRAALRRVKSGDHRIDNTAAFRKAAASVIVPTSVFGYVDGKAAFEQIYSTLKPLVMMSAAFLPNTKNYIDIEKMPSVESVSRHLGPIVYSQGSDRDGLLFESTGVVTFSQMVFGTAAGVAAAAVPAMKAQLLNPNALQQGQLPFSIPTPAPPPPAASPTPDATNLPTPQAEATPEAVGT
jgi:hypothetical protein